MVDWKTCVYEDLTLEEGIELIKMYAEADPENSQYCSLNCVFEEAERLKKNNPKGSSTLGYFYKYFNHKDPKSKPLSISDWSTCGYLATMD